MFSLEHAYSLFTLMRNTWLINIGRSKSNQLEIYNFSLFTKPKPTAHTPPPQKCCNSPIHQRLFCNNPLNHNTRSSAKSFETLILELDVIRKSRSRIEGFSHHYLSKSLGFSHLEKLLQVGSS